jgi:hypothetical protein
MVPTGAVDALDLNNLARLRVDGDRQQIQI